MLPPQAAVTAQHSTSTSAPAAEPRPQTPAMPSPAPDGLATAAQAIAFLSHAPVQPTPSMWAAALQPAAASTDHAVPVAGIAVEIASRAQDGQRQFDIRLDPPDLGRIEVRLTVDSNGHVSSHLVADRSDTLERPSTSWARP
jgi:flagellar hook-length control protein FliK